MFGRKRRSAASADSGGARATQAALVGEKGASGPRRQRVPWKWGVGAGLLAFVLLGAGIAIADVPDGNTVFGCENNSTHAVRIIDKTNTACVAGETQFSWSVWKWRGAYNAASQYSGGDVVFFRASSYVVIVKPATPNVPPTNMTDWALLDQGVNWKGAWSAVTAYLPGDAVSYLGASYLAVLASTNKVPTSNPTFWSVLAARGATGATGAQGPGTPQLSKASIAKLRWDQDPARGQTANVGTTPVVDAFDGTNIWVSNFAAGTLSKIVVATGAVTTPTTGLSFPGAIAFDGTNLWVTNAGSNTVSEVRPSDGAILHTVSGLSDPVRVAFDGTKVWVTNYTANTVSRINPTGTPAVDATTTVGTNPYGIAFDGTHLWVANLGSNTVSEIDPASGSVIGAPISVGPSPSVVAFDGDSVWVANNSAGTVSKINHTTATVVATVTVGNNPEGFAFDGTHLWVTLTASGAVAKIDPTTDAVVTTGGDAFNGPEGIAFDGTDMWITNAGANTVVKARTP
jgi:YVTN family beta-propeller protein